MYCGTRMITEILNDGNLETRQKIIRRVSSLQKLSSSQTRSASSSAQNVNLLTHLDACRLNCVELQLIYFLPRILIACLP